MFEQDAKIRQQIKSLQKQIRKCPLLFARLGECYLRLGDWEHAEPILKKGVREHPDYVSGHLVLGEGYLYQGLYGDAEECVKQGLSQQPSHLGLLKLMRKIKKVRESDDGIREAEALIKKLDPLFVSEETGGVGEANGSGELDDQTGGSIGETAVPASIWKMKAAAQVPQTDIAAGKPTDRAHVGLTDRQGAPVADELKSEAGTTNNKPGAEDSHALPVRTAKGPTISEERPTLHVLASDTKKPISPSPKKIATRTLGELYATQNKFDEAIEIYEKLAANDPENSSYRERLEELKARRDTALGTPGDTENV